MNAANLFAQLSTKSASYAFMPFGGADESVNIALYTQGMLHRAYVAARFVWSKDLSVHAELTELVTENTLKIAGRESWNLTRCEQRIKTLVALAMIEHYAPNIFRTQKSRYLYCGIPESQWYRLWAKRYEVPYRMVSGYLDIAWRSVHK